MKLSFAAVSALALGLFVGACSTPSAESLAQNGVAEGSYLVLPFAGPKPPRDLLGTGVDVAFDPLTYATFHGSGTWMVVRFGIGILDSRTATLDAVDTIERSSIDFYATTR